LNVVSTSAIKTYSFKVISDGGDTCQHYLEVSRDTFGVNPPQAAVAISAVGETVSKEIDLSELSTGKYYVCGWSKNSAGTTPTIVQTFNYTNPDMDSATGTISIDNITHNSALVKYAYDLENSTFNRIELKLIKVSDGSTVQDKPITDESLATA